MRKSLLVWLLVAGAGLVLSVVGLFLQGNYDEQTRSVTAPIWPPPGFVYPGEPNEVVYLTPDHTTYHRINCVHRTIVATQVLVKNLPKGATPCAACIIPPLSTFNLDPPPGLLFKTRVTQWTGGITLATGIIGLLIAALSGPPLASRAPAFPVEPPANE